MYFLVVAVSISFVILAVAAVIEQVRLYKERHKDTR